MFCLENATRAVILKMRPAGDQANQAQAKGKRNPIIPTSAVYKRWTPSFGQVFVTATVESGVMIQATLGGQETGRSPGLVSAPS